MENVGDVSYSIAAEKDGYVQAHGQTISNTGNGGDLEGAEYENLFNLVTGLPMNVGNAPVWSTGKAIVPNLQGRVVAGVDVSANILTGVFDASILCNEGGSETHTLTEDELASHTHSETRKGTHNVQAGNNKQSGNPNDSTVNSGSAGGDKPHDNVQPTMALNVFIKY